MRISLGIEIEPHDSDFCRVRNDHPGAPGGGAAVSAQAGFDVNKTVQEFSHGFRC